MLVPVILELCNLLDNDIVCVVISYFCAYTHTYTSYLDHYN